MTEAANRKTYVGAHAYTPEAVRLAVKNGVKCIEHGNMLDAETAQVMVEHDAYLVPTLVTYKGMADFGKKLGFPERSLRKNEAVLAAGVESLAIATSAGVKMGLGTDLIGETQVYATPVVRHSCTGRVSTRDSAFNVCDQPDHPATPRPNWSARVEHAQRRSAYAD